MRKIILGFLFVVLSVFSAHAQIYTMSNTSVTTCSGTFYDSGGQTGNYGNNENLTMKFTSANGNRLSFSFGALSMYLGDYISIYDGPFTAYYLIGSYATNLPPVITSSGSSLTILCFSTSSANDPGWNATITCARPELPVYNVNNGTVTTCSGVFYDNGGAAGNYSNNDNGTTTFTSANGQYLKFDLNPNHFKNDNRDYF